MRESSLALAQSELIPGVPNAVIVGVGALFALLILFVFLKWGFLWIRAKMAGAGVSMFDLIGMSLRKVNPYVIVEARIMSTKGGVPIETRDLEALYLAGGNVIPVVQALIAASKASIPLVFEQAAGIALAGRDVKEAVRTSVLPKVIDCPDARKGRETLDAVAGDGIQLKIKARVTVRMNIRKIIGGAMEETVIARVGEGIVSSIGSTASYKDVLANPDHISKQVLAKGLDANTAYEIVSIDIADVDVGDNIGARLRVDQAEADMKMYQAEAEKRRALAYAREAEMRALDQENRAKVTLAEAEVPLAMATALREGKLGVLDLYGLRNLQADTDMRKSIAAPPSAPEKDKKG
jgi:uncharacterized protein YqfA (UPF0365 family)